jgi:rRNA maturation endonuclease Nob1
MILVAACVALVAAALIFTLFVRESDLPQAEAVSPTWHLEERKAAIYENLRDLQFEYRVGKLSDADYQQTKLGLQRELSVVLADIDKIAGVSAAASSTTPQASAPVASAPEAGTVCPSCKATFPKPLKFCGECGKAMA